MRFLWASLLALVCGLSLNASEEAGEQHVLENEHVRVTVDLSTAAISKMSLKGSGPITLPYWLAADEKSEETTENATQTAVVQESDEEPSLDVLGQFNHVTYKGGKSWPQHNLLSLDESVTDGAWQKGAASAQVVTLSKVSKDGMVRYTLVYTLVENSPRVTSTFSVQNNGAETFAFTPYLFAALNGVHQDLGRNDDQYVDLVQFEKDGEGIDSLDIPVVEGAEGADLTKRIARGEGEPISLKKAEYIGLRGRFFLAMWKPLSFKIKAPVGKPVVEEAADTQTVSGQAPAFDEEEPVVSDIAENSPLLAYPKADVKGFQNNSGYLAERQALVGIRWWNGVSYKHEIKAGHTLEVSWQTTVSSFEEDDLALLSDNEQQMQYTSSYYRFFRVLVDPLLGLLTIIYACFSFIGLSGIGYGLSVIVLTLMVKGLLHKITYKQQKSMMMMQKLGPEIKALQNTYKDDRQQLAAKQMELWKKHGVNPLGGCLPMFIQMPIFIALFQAFNHAAEFRAHGFLWVDDLSQPDQVFPLGFDWPFINSPATLNFLPLLYIATAFWMSSLTRPPQQDQKTPGTDSEKMQQDMMKMMRWLPVIFGVFFYNMPAGLVLYFVCSSLIGALEIRYIRKKLGMA